MDTLHLSIAKLRLRAALPAALVLAVCAAWAVPAHAQPRLHRGGVDVVPPPVEAKTFQFELTAGVASVEEFDGAEAFVALTPRWRLMGNAKGTLDLSLPLLWIPGSHGAPDFDPFEELFDLRPTGTEIGSSLVLAPGFEWTFCGTYWTKDCWQPSIFVGAGVRQDRDRSTRLGGEQLELGDVESPVLTFGAAVHRRLNRKLGLRVEARALTTFYDDESFFVDAAGLPVGFEGSAVTSLWLSAGIRFGR